MFGDFDTGLTLTELSRYSRRMTGGKTEYKSSHVEVSGFAAETTLAYQRNEIHGDGTSGLYRLSGKNILLNSEKVSIVVRDRFRSEVIISTRTMSRFVDYSIDYDAGTLFFKEPIPSKDENFNPITIVVEYESNTAVQDYTYGGRFGIKLLDKRIKVGVSHIHEGLGERRNDLFGLDTAIQLTDSTRLRGEAATTDSTMGAVTTSGYAYLAELQHSTRKMDAKAYVKEQQAGFGLGQQMGSENGTRKFGLEGTYRLHENLSGNATIYRQTNLASGSNRDVAEGKVSYGTKLYGVSLGLLHASDHLADGRYHGFGADHAGRTRPDPE